MAFQFVMKFVDDIATGVFRGVVGSDFAQSILGLPGNLVEEAARLAVKAAWTKSLEQPDDALSLVGEERLLNSMPLESPSSYRKRLSNAWTIWDEAGNPLGIEDALAAGGYPLNVIERQEWPLNPPIGYWSIFWLMDAAPPNNSIKAGPAPTYAGGATYGQPTQLYGMTDLTVNGNLTEVISSICCAVRKTRPAHVILGHIIVPGTAPLYGLPSGTTYAGGATYGGTPPIIINC
jgi:hypothetical protein